MERLLYKNIAIDFDGTIADNLFPDVGVPRPHAIRVIEKIRRLGGKVIIWTCRTGQHAEDAKEFLALYGIKYDAFNDNLPECKEIFPDNGRKVWADVYIDDRANFCKEIDWLWVESNLFIKIEGEDNET